MGMEMKKGLLVGVAGVALLAGAAANAADLGTRAPYKTPPVAAPVPIFSWTGCYVGAHVGGGWGRKDFSDVPVEVKHGSDGFFVGDGNGAQSIRATTSGFLGGGQVGCDYQFAPNWLIGIQVSGSGADVKGDVLDPFFGGGGKVFHAKTDWIADVTGRVGVTWDRFMVYGKGGVAWAGDKHNVSELSGFAYTASETRAGWTAGVGLEWAFWNNWSAFFEYDFYGFGHRDLSFTCTSAGGFCGVFGPVTVKQDINAVKFGINWRWGWGKAPAPVVAKY
jgi:outer membrane immunogenic protein